MIIEKDFSVYDIESRMPLVRREEQLRIPISMSHGGVFGVDCALAQLVITWARHQESGVLHLYSSGAELENHVLQLSKSMAGLAGMVMSPSFHTDSHHSVTRPIVLGLIKPIVQAMYSGDLRGTYSSRGARPSAINLFCVNNANREFIQPFYYHQGSIPKLQPRNWFSSLVEKVVAELLSSSDQTPKFLASINSLGEVLYELVANSHEHAISDVYGLKYRRALRGVSFKLNRVNSLDLTKYVKGEEEFSRFIAKQLTGRSGYLKYFEISVIDSGPGLARRWLTKKEGSPVDSLDGLSLEAETKATLDCFKKHFTTKDSESSGMGLHNAIQSLNRLGAFLKVRTGRLSLYQSFSGKNDLAEFSPKKWASEGPLSVAEGTSFTICIPVGLDG